MKNALLFLFFVFSLFNSFAEDKAIELVKFKLSPDAPQVNEKASVLLFPEKFTGDIPLNTVLEAEFEGEQVSLEYISTNLWKFSSPTLLEAKEYTLSVSVYLEDKKEADILRKEIINLDVEIEGLNVQIQRESDPEIVKNLTLQKEEKESDKSDLQDLLLSLKRFVGVETFQFLVNESRY